MPSIALFCTAPALALAAACYSVQTVLYGKKVGRSTESEVCAVLQSSSNSTAGQVAANPKITPRLPPPPPPMPQNSTPPTVSACSGYVTKEEIVAGLEYAAGQEYLPFDPWSAAAAPRALLPCINACEGLQCRSASALILTCLTDSDVQAF